ncbi:unnamed protein product [Paramecium sonneborni]|uniref:Myb-like domain-containing protein n=1 Tax=Paramecium sonneborni TaxID=65129 RepID=A0A8S1NMG2_9CILI|nr:unnamed protein product [Paramecium sonneborni]
MRNFEGVLSSFQLFQYQILIRIDNKYSKYKMNVQQFPNFYPYMLEPQIPFQGENEQQQKQNSSSNQNEFNLIQQNFYPSAYHHYQFEYVQDHEIPSQIKNKKHKKKKNNDQKGLLPKTLESEKQVVEDCQQIAIHKQGEEILKPITPYTVLHFTQGSAMPKLQSDIVSNQQNDGPVVQQEGSQQTQKEKGQNQQTKKPKKENINTGHWSTEEHTTYIQFLQQFENIMTCSMMKKTSKIFKQMSELIGTRTPSQCRSHHQKFNPYALRGENGKRLPRTERSRAGRKKKNPQSDLPKAGNDYKRIKEEANLILNYEGADPYYLMMLEQQKYFYSGFNQDYWNQVQEMDQNQNIKKEEEIDNQNHGQILQPEFEEYFKYSFQRYGNQQDYNFDVRNQTVNDLII